VKNEHRSLHLPAEDVPTVGKALATLPLFASGRGNYDIKIDRGRGKLSTKDQGLSLLDEMKGEKQWSQRKLGWPVTNGVKGRDLRI
jgi:hypothetical protein